MSYHDRIMNLVITKAAPDIWREATNEIESALCNGFCEADIETAYACGHRDARHAAAEIATEADTEIEKYRTLLAKALPLIEAEAERRDDAFMSDSAFMETEQSTIHYWTEMRELANEIAKEKGVE